MAVPNNVSYAYDTLATTTLQLMRTRIADTVFKANPTAAWFLSRGRVRTESGGKWIEEPLMYSKNTTIGAYRGYEPLNVNPTEELTMARYNWRQAAGSVTISGLEELQNNGDAAVFNMLRQKIKILEMSFKEWFDEKLHAATNTKDLAREILGLAEIIENTAEGAQGTLGGIDKSTYGWWGNKRSAPSATSVAYSTRPLSKAMLSFFNDCSKGLSKPDLLISDQQTYEDYELENHDLLRLSTPADRAMLDVGFVNQRFKGATWMWNENAEDNLLYFLNSEFLSFVIHANRNFVMTPFAKPHNQDARTAQMLFAGNMTCNNGRFQGVMDTSGITYS